MTTNDRTRRDEVLAEALGYHYVTDPDRFSRPLRDFVLPVDPFRRIGPFVVVRELVLHVDGHRIGERRLLRWMPRRRVTT